MNPYVFDVLAKLETAGGAKTIKGPNGEDSYNLYNIKDFSGNGYRAYDKAEGSRDAYRVFQNKEEADAALADLLTRKYPGALEAATGEDLAKALVGGQHKYATDPAYAQKIVSVWNGQKKSSPMAAAISPGLQPFMEGGWAEEIKFAKSKGVSDDQILKELQAEQGRLQQVQQEVAQGTARGDDPTIALTKLRKAGWDSEIDFALSKGVKPEQIVAEIAPVAYKQGKDANTRMENDGILGNVWEGAKDTVSGLVRGGKQIAAQVSGNDARTKELQAEELAARNDLDRVARGESTSATVGGVVPYLATALIPGVNTIGGAAALGAATGALQPVVEGESRGTNALVGGAMGGGSVAGAKLLGKALGAAGRAARGGSVDEVTKKIADLEAQGIRVSAADVSPAANKVANTAKQVWGGNALGADGRVGRDVDLARAITARIGNPADEISSEVYAGAKANTSALYDDALAGVDIAITPVQRAQFRTMLKEIIDEAPSNARKGVAGAFASDMQKISNGSISAKTLNTLRSELGNQSAAPSVSPIQKAELNKLRSGITDTLEQGLPKENFAKWKAANEQYRNLQAVQKIVVSNNDSGAVSGRQLSQAIKGAYGKEAFAKGVAPFQDIQKSLGNLQTGNETLIGNMGLPGTSSLLQAIGAVGSGGASIAAVIPAQLALRITTSTNPAVRKALLMLGKSKQKEIEQLALMAALSAQSNK